MRHVRGVVLLLGLWEFGGHVLAGVVVFDLGRLRAVAVGALRHDHWDIRLMRVNGRRTADTLTLVCNWLVCQRPI